MSTITMGVNEAVDALRCSRSEFRNLFWQAQAAARIDRIQRVEFEALARNFPDDKAAFREGLTYAETQGFFLKLLTLVASAELESGAISQYLLDSDKLTAADNAPLHAMTNPAAGFTEPLLYSKGIMRGTQLTGKVWIDGVAMGTGVLIGPHLFLTAFHVVEPMYNDGQIDQNGKVVYSPRLNPPNLEVEFNNILDEVNNSLTTTQSLRVKAHKDWNVCFCKCHEDELAQKIPPEAELKDNWDYAIIKLAKPIGMERRWIAPNSNATLQLNSHIVLFQHPAAVSLKMDHSEIVGLVPEPGEYRFLHDLNATGASSGGPCFDKEFRLIGIHQGAWNQPINGKVANRGIPITKIIEHYKGIINTLPLPDPADCPVWCLDKKNYEPIIGCDEFQAMLWNVATGNEIRVIRISGGEKTGKSFLVRLAGLLLNDADHLKIELPAETIARMDALTLARFICSTAGAEIPPFKNMLENDNTPVMWVKGELFNSTKEALLKKAGKRLIWLCLTDMNKFTLEGEHAADLLLHFYEWAKSDARLRIILDGLRTRLPVTFDNSIENPLTRNFTEQDIAAFFRRSFADFNVNTPENVITATSGFMYTKYNEYLVNDQLTALQQVASDCRLMLKQYLK